MVFRPYTGRIVSGRVAKAGNKDPRFVTGSNNPRLQPDIAQFADLRQEMGGDFGQLPQSYAHAVAAASAQALDVSRTLATRVQMLAWTVTTPLSNVIGLLIPKNLNRLSLVLCNPNPPNPTGSVTFNEWMFSFSFPILNSAGFPIGATIGRQTVLIFDGDSCPYDDIFVWTNAAGPITLFGWEGIQAPEANP